MKLVSKTLLFVCAAGLCLADKPCLAQATASPTGDSFATLIRQDLAAPTLDFDPNDPDAHVQLDSSRLRALYQLRNFRPIWVNEQGPTNLGSDLKNILNDESEQRGFDRRYYWFNSTESRFGAKDAASLAELDLLMTAGYMDYASNLAKGRVDPKDETQNLRDIEFPANPAPTNAELLAIAANSRSLYGGLERLEPNFTNYLKLKDTLWNLKNAESFGGWPAFQGMPVLKFGMKHPNVVAVRVRLVDMGALDRAQRKNSDTTYDATMMQAVMRLQQVMFQKPDGMVGPSTYQMLNVPLEDRIDQTRANLERWRLLPRTLGEPCPSKTDCSTWTNRFVFVDLGRQELDVLENNKPVMRMKVVVGRDLRQTPTMQDRIMNVVINPYWTAPTSIVLKDILPKLRSNPNYLSAMHMRILQGNRQLSDDEVQSINWAQYTPARLDDIEHQRLSFPWTFREDPGPQNSLGVLKFNLTNSHAIYMHDTNERWRFKQNIRYYSSGCIRLEDPLGLAQYLLADKGYDSQRIQTEIDNPENKAHPVIPLSKPVKVYIMATTMTAYTKTDADAGIVAFREDVYKQDKRIVDAMDGLRVEKSTYDPTSQIND